MINKLLQRKLFKGYKPLSYKINYNYFNQQPNNFDAKKDYYKILGLNKNSSQSQIKKSYYRMAKEYHPDVNKGNQSKFKEISEAYQVLSNEQTRSSYDSSRIFREGFSRMGQKAQQGSYSYEEYRNVYSNMSPGEREQFTRESQERFKKILIYVAGFILFWMFFTRRPNRFYAESNGSLIPIQPPNGGQQYVQNSMGQPPYTGYNSTIPPVYNQGYTLPSQSAYNQPPVYGSQYPQSQYIPNNIYSNQGYQAQSYQPQGYSQSNQPGQTYGQPTQARSIYAVDRPQAHQPYPNSGYGEKPMQTNYRQGYQTQAPKGLSD